MQLSKGSGLELAQFLFLNSARRALGFAGLSLTSGHFETQKLTLQSPGSGMKDRHTRLFEVRGGVGRVWNLTSAWFSHLLIQG
jgi:hypothetical protein